MMVTQVDGHGGLSLVVEGHRGHYLLGRESALPSRGMVTARKTVAPLSTRKRMMDTHQEMIAALIGNLQAAIDLSMTGKTISGLTGNLRGPRGTMTTGAAAGITIGRLIIGQNQERGSRGPQFRVFFFLLYSPVLLYMQ